MADYWLGRGGEIIETATDVTFKMVVRTADGKADLGVVEVKVMKPITGGKINQSITTALANLAPQGRGIEDILDATLRQRNREA